ncbi:MAG TPA: YihY/virulence factor BrkB family protein [Pseudonocardia sp.]|jgi:membrane protein|uniref:YihY/virulence factor BrkB family protein n=1 Tax=Pseudonocardia sp. TaxID=60912 RepID=UPI002ED85242
MRLQAGDDEPPRPIPPISGSPARRLAVRTLSKAWDDGIFAMSAQTAYWSTLSLPPLLLGLLGSMGYVAGWFGPETLVAVQHGIIRFSGTIFNHEVVSQFIEPTVADILNRGRPDIISVGFPIALVAGSSAISSLVDSITFAHEQYSVRHPVWQRIFALLIYLVALVFAVITLPLLTLGPAILNRVLPNSWTPTVLNAINTFYYPVVMVVIVIGLTTLYKVSLPRSLPWHRLLPGAVLAMLVFAVSALGLRIYIAAITGAGYTYGALATPIAFLLFAFLIGFAVVLGAQLNNAIQEIWPVLPEHRRRRIQQKLGVRKLAEALGMAREPAPAPRGPSVTPATSPPPPSGSPPAPESHPHRPRPQPGAHHHVHPGSDRMTTGSDQPSG